MLPSVLASQVRFGIENFLRATFPIGSPYFSTLWDDFFQRPRELFRGPYYTVQLPFRSGASDYAFPSGFSLGFAPHQHQYRAFERLCGAVGQSALIATGTGSGKTECFLYPLLDHCLTTKNERGVKAIVVYPMNALATDQAKRFAREIWNRPELKGNVTVGLFIGGLKANEGVATMTEESVITRKETMLEYPPDILLTNYKELDYLLVRAKDARLWRKNARGTLRWVVVDELHTFDGAQGTDLACLLKRVCSRLQTRAEDVNRIGSSATLGGDGDYEKLLEFARVVFGGNFDAESIITETQKNSNELLDGESAFFYGAPRDERNAASMNPERYATPKEYLNAQVKLWFGSKREFFQTENDRADRVELGGMLKQLKLFRELVRRADGRTFDVDALTDELGSTLDFLERDEEGARSFHSLDKRFRESFFASFFALISYALAEDGRPLLRVRVQLWTRETARLVASVAPLPRDPDDPDKGSAPRLTFLSEIKKEEDSAYLPLVHCRSCGRVGYVGVEQKNNERLSGSAESIYQAFFSDREPDLVYIYVDSKNDGEKDKAIARERNLFDTKKLCPSCLTVAEANAPDACPKCGREMLEVEFKRPEPKPEGGLGRPCPYCGECETAIVGARSARLTTVALERLFSSKYNDDKKLLAFSDSVQDASHKAGFFTGRAYRSNFRAALQQYVASFEHTPGVKEVCDGFADFWFERFLKEEQGIVARLKASQSARKRAYARFITQFLPTDLQSPQEDFQRDLFDVMKRLGIIENDELEAKFYEKTVRRLRWEILSEFGRLSDIGRTLEKTRFASLALKPETRRAWIDAFLIEARENLGLKRLPDLELKVARLVVSFVREARKLGAICAPELDDYMRDGSTYALHKKQPHIPTFARGRRPLFIQSDGAAVREFVNAFGTSRTTRFSKLAVRALGLAEGKNADEILRAFFAVGERVGALRKIAVKKGGFAQANVWGLEQNALVVERNLDRRRGAVSKKTICTPGSEREFWDGFECGEREGDVFERVEGESDDFAGGSYARADVCRVVAREHTGLLERSERETLENEFIAGTDGNVAATNALSCTPTLEMGVNIGSLSCVALCSSPPTRAAFAQRIGRGGRRDGNSFNFIVATNRPRDLYYFNEPEEAFDGPVDPPGVFLNAPTVLERQLFAYSFDRWIKDECDAKPSELERKSIVPFSVKELLAPNQSFPQRFFSYLDARRDAIFQDFCAMFGGALEDSTIDALKDYYCANRGNALQARLYARVEKTRALREGYRKKATNLQKKYKETQASSAPSSEDKLKELRALKDEQTAFRRAIETLEGKTTYEFLTDEGFLPNYAFPEEGARLRSSLWGVGEDKRETLEQEYSRPASAALSEFVPGASFYASGRKLCVNRVDATGALEVEDWRFCGDCGCSRKITDADVQTQVCPRCGSLSWGDGALTRRVLKLDRVVADQPDWSSRSFDDAERRATKRYYRETLVDFKEPAPDKAWKIQGGTTPFGFEYWSKADFKDVNFGEYGSERGGVVQIAGGVKPNVGFSVCKSCGAAASGDNKIDHAPGCRYRRQENDAKSAIECVYLYREFQSEALRLAMPVVGSSRASFVAGVRLALREYFKGNVDHIKTVETSQNDDDSKLRPRFLTLYDVVPGGTGYLKQFAQKPRILFKAFQLAIDRMRNCACIQDPEKDGCYRCILEFRQGKDATSVSQKEAIEALGEIVDEWKAQDEKLETIDGLGKIDFAGKLESELEKRFVERFRNYTTADGTRVSLTSTIDGGEEAYELNVDEKRFWRMRCQPKFGAAQGFAHEFRPDFLIKPLRGESNVKPVVVFTDGFAFHADSADGKYRLPLDVAQRNALVASNRFCWSLTYWDVDGDDAPGARWEPLVSSVFSPSCVPSCFKSLVDASRWGATQRGAFDALVEYLARPEETTERGLALAVAVLSKEESGQTFCRGSDEQARDLWNALTRGQDFDESFESIRRARGKSGVWGLRARKVTKRLATFWFVKLPTTRSDVSDAFKSSRVLLILDDETPFESSHDAEEFKKDWNSWLAAFNLLQFLPGARLLTRRTAREGAPNLNWDDFVEANDAGCEQRDDWALALEDAPEARAILEQARAQGWEPPETWGDVAVAGGVVTVPCAWHERRVFWHDVAEEVALLERSGWTLAGAEILRGNVAH